MTSAFSWQNSISLCPASFCIPRPFSSLNHSGWGIDLDYCDIEWLALEMNRDHSVFLHVVCGDPLVLTTSASCVMATSKYTVIGSETFSTGLMNWL